MKGTGPLAFAILALACTHAGADPKQPQATDPRKVGGFTAIEVIGTMAVDAHIDSATKVEVVGDADLVKLVSTTVKNGALVIDTPKDFLKRRKDAQLKVIVTAPDISRVAVSGTGAITLDGLTSKSLAADISGIGSLVLKGKTERLHLAISGTGEVKAKELVAADVDVHVGGTADAQVHATKSFESDVSGTAVVKVRGNPATVKKKASGVAMIDVK